MKKHTIIALLAIFQSVSASAADTFTLNEMDITVPAPKGFVRITDNMETVTRFVQQMNDPVNDTLAYYIQESDVPAAMAGELPELERTFILKVNKKIRNFTIGKDYFSQLKEMTRSQNRQMLEDAKLKIPEHMGKISQGLSQEFDIDFAMSISQVVPLEPHYEEENALAYSMYINYGITAEDQKIQDIVASTATFLNVSGTVLFLYSYASKDDLEWTRSESMKWAESVIASNNQPPSKTPKRGIDWGEIGEEGLVGSIVGGIFALIFGLKSLFKKKKD